MEKKFCKNCKNCYGIQNGNRVNQCNIKTGLETLIPKDSAYTENIVLDKEKLNLAIAFGDLDWDKVEFFLSHSIFYHKSLTGEYTYGFPSQLNYENDCPFYEEKEKNILEKVNPNKNEFITKVNSWINFVWFMLGILIALVSTVIYSLVK